MPYSRVDLINAFRVENPDAKDIPDNKIFAAIAVEDPALAKGISELQPPASPDRSITNPNVIGPMLGGVGPTALGDRIMGSVAAVVNGLFPAGDTKRNIPPPALTPDQEIGAKTVAVAGAADLAGSIASKARNAIAESDVPRKMLQRSEDIRAASGPLPAATIPTSKSAMVNTAIRKIAAQRANAYESAGNALAGPDRLPLTRGEVAADEAARMAQINRNPPVVQDVTPATPALNVPRPTTPQFVQNQLERARAAETPEQLYARQQAVRDAEIPPREAQTASALNVPRPGIAPNDAAFLQQIGSGDTVTLLKEPSVQPFKDAGPKVSGLTVREFVPNMSSVPATLENYEELPGIKEVPLASFTQYEPPALTERVKNLASDISASGELNPLIVAYDADGPYIIEGGHRLDAAIHLGKKSIPAKVVIDTENPPSWYRQEIPFTPPEGWAKDFAFRKSQAMGTLKAPEVNKWLGVRPDDVTHGANPGQQVLDEGLLGPTKEATQANVATSLKNAGMQLEARLKTADAKGLTIDAQTPVYDAAASATKRIGAPKDATFSAQLNGVVDDIEAKYPDLGKLKPSDAHKLKVELGNSIDWKNSDNPVNQMMKQIYRSINSSIGSVDETIAPAQRRWGNLYIADRTLKTGIAKDLVGKGTGPQPVQKFGFGVTR